MKQDWGFILATPTDEEQLGEVPGQHEEYRDLGPCCSCLKADCRARILVFIPRQGSTPGRGWGCLTCGLPPEGAFAVVCDPCARRHERQKNFTWTMLKTFVTLGEDGSGKGRAPIDTLLTAAEWVHDLSRHPEEQ